MKFDKERWPSFSESEIACKCCGEVFVDPVAMDALQRLRNSLGGPLTIECGHRCVAHNKAVGGAARSTHLQLAFDLVLAPYSRGSMLSLARDAGFKRFGLMKYGLHVDCHPVDSMHAEMWTYGAESRRLWAGLFDEKKVKDW